MKDQRSCHSTGYAAGTSQQLQRQQRAAERRLSLGTGQQLPRGLRQGMAPAVRLQCPEATRHTQGGLVLTLHLHTPAAHLHLLQGC
jgi:hypothetical protein